MSAPRDDAAKREHRGVRRQHDELAARRGQCEPTVERPLELRDDLEGVGIEPRVLETKRELRGPVARHDHPLEPVEERLEVHVPDPRRVFPVGDRVVQRDHGQLGGRARNKRPHGLVGAGRILDQEHQQGTAAAHLDPLEAAERRVEALEARDDLVEGRAQGTCERCRRERVVDVVETRQAKRHAALLARCSERRTTRRSARRARSPSRRP